jgi:hypothetical protein
VESGLLFNAVARSAVLVELDALVERLALVGRAALVALVNVSALAATTNRYQKHSDQKRYQREFQNASGINNDSLASSESEVCSWI